MDYPELPLDKNYFLSDATAALYGLGAGAAPNDVLQKLADAVRLTGGALKKPNGGTITLPAASITGLASRLIAYGAYTGNGAASRSINVGFAPGAVFVFDRGLYTWQNNNGVWGGLALSGHSIVLTPGGESRAYPCIEVSGSGFYVYHDSSRSIRTNVQNTVYHYIAFNKGA